MTMLESWVLRRVWCVCIYAHMHIHSDVHAIHMFAWMRSRVQACVRTHMSVWMHMKFLCMCSNMYVCMQMRTCVRFHVYTRTHACMNISCIVHSHKLEVKQLHSYTDVGVHTTRMLKYIVLYVSCSTYIQNGKCRFAKGKAPRGRQCGDAADMKHHLQSIGKVWVWPRTI